MENRYKNITIKDLAKYEKMNDRTAYNFMYRYLKVVIYLQIIL